MPGERYQWSGRCTCGDRIRIHSSTPEAIQDLAALWREKHPADHGVRERMEAMHDA